MKVEVKKISLENYKKFPSKSVDLFPRTEISGRNREGKSTLQDAYLDVLTGKMANGTEPTSVRRKENGVEVEEDIVREIETVINGREITLKKVTKKGKSSSSTSYFLNGGVKLSKADFNDFLKEEIASPETIAMCSNPSVFLNMLRKSTSDARETLTKICKFDMEEFISSNPSFKLAKEIIKDKSIKNKSPEEAVKALRSDLKEKKAESKKTSDDISKLSKEEDGHTSISSMESKNRSLMRNFPNWKNRNRFLKVQKKAMTAFHMKSVV
ncbi:MAG: AAA family ATPase [Blautia faecis]